MENYPCLILVHLFHLHTLKPSFISTTTSTSFVLLSLFLGSSAWVCNSTKVSYKFYHVTKVHFCLFVCVYLEHVSCILFGSMIMYISSNPDKHNHDAHFDITWWYWFNIGYFYWFYLTKVHVDALWSITRVSIIWCLILFIHIIFIVITSFIFSYMTVQWKLIQHRLLLLVYFNNGPTFSECLLRGIFYMLILYNHLNSFQCFLFSHVIVPFLFFSFSFLSS